MQFAYAAISFEKLVLGGCCTATDGIHILCYSSEQMPSPQASVSTNLQPKLAKHVLLGHGASTSKEQL